MKSSRHYGELCYPFIHETSTLCDFEMVTDELCTLIGMALSVWLLGASLSWAFWQGAAMVCAGAILCWLATRR